MFRDVSELERRRVVDRGLRAGERLLCFGSVGSGVELLAPYWSWHGAA